MIKLRKSKELSQDEIENLEDVMGASLPDDYRQFLPEGNGAEPEPNIFQIDDRNDSGVNEFIPVNAILRERGFLEETIPASAIPIAWAEGGNYVCLDVESGVVFFWDHEEPEEHGRLAATFFDFLELLEPFDVSSVELRPGQVRSVWVDPDLFGEGSPG